jgi:iron-sulfur cluster assembly protein
MIEISKRAIKELKIAIEEHKAQNADSKDIYVRIGIKGGGCSGYQHTLVLDENKTSKDQIFNVEEGIDVVIDPKSALYLEGASLDFQDELNHRGFKFSNPMSKTTCGCSQSFSM